MVFLRLSAALAIICAAEPALAATLQPSGGSLALGVAGKAYLRVPLGGRHAANPHAGLGIAVSRQDRDIAGHSMGMRRDVEAVGLRFGPAERPALMLAGTPLNAADRRNASDDGSEHSPWRTAAFVAGGLLLAAGATALYVHHQAEKNSD
jgi:hypothetical protein